MTESNNTPSAAKASANAVRERERPDSNPHERPDLLAVGEGRLSSLELKQIRFIRNTYESARSDRLLRVFQKGFGAWWINVCTRQLRRVHGLERVPQFEPEQSYMFVSNHRSFFDLYVITMMFVKQGLKQRIIFPVRSKFFYDSYLGLFVNGLMSGFAMYPPIFRERSKAVVTAASLQELSRLLRRGGFFTGIHPEGTRNTDADPLKLLPGQPGVGRIIREAGVPVIPVFINGLLPKDLKRQVLGNFDGSGRKIYIVFGHPIDFSQELQQKPSPRVYRGIADRCMAAIHELGLEEQTLRAQAGD